MALELYLRSGGNHFAEGKAVKKVYRYDDFRLGGQMTLSELFLGGGVTTPMASRIR